MANFLEFIPHIITATLQVIEMAVTLPFDVYYALPSTIREVILVSLSILSVLIIWAVWRNRYSWRDVEWN